MSHAPQHDKEDATSDQAKAFLQANTRREELLRNGVSFSGQERNCCFLNVGGGRFANVSAAAGLDHIGDGRAYAVVDWDHDGDLDLWTTNRNSPRVQFLQNNTTVGNRWLAVRLQGDGATTNRDAVGARVEVVLDDPKASKLIKTVRAGEGFLSQSSKTLHFGLGAADRVRRLLVHWPGGDSDEYLDLESDRVYMIAQNAQAPKVWSRPQAASPLTKAPDAAPQPGAATTIPLRRRMPVPELKYETLAGRTARVLRKKQSPTLVTLWASWCRPCLTELVELGKSEDELRRLDLEVVALSIDKLAADASSDPQQARSFLKRREFPFKAGFATAEFTNQIEAILYYLFDFRRPWAVPTSFLFDRQDRLAVIYVGPVALDALASDLRRLELGEEAWFDAAMPFAGTWSGQRRHPSLLQYIRTFADRSLDDDVENFVSRFDELLRGDPDYGPFLLSEAARAQQAGLADRARQQYRRVLDAAPDNSTAPLRLAEMHAEKQQYEQATQLVRRVLEKNGQSADAHFFLAKLLTVQGARDEAVTHFRRAVEIQPDSLQAWQALGDAYAGDAEWEHAAEARRQAAELAPDNASVRHQLGQAQQKAGRVKQALANYRRAAELQPDSANFLVSLGVVYAQLDESRQAVEQLRRAIKLQPDSLRGLNALAWVLATGEASGVEETQEAVRAAERAAKITSRTNARVLDTLAAAQAANGQFDRAVATANEAIGLAKRQSLPKLAAEIQRHRSAYRSRETLHEQ